MEIRWVIRQVSADKIEAYQIAHGCGVEEAKKQLGYKEKVLQYFDDEWKDVPTVFQATFS